MKHFFKKIMFWLRVSWHYLFYGMKSADVLMTNGGKSGDSDSPTINQEIGGGGVFKDLLEEKKTQEVQELVYTSYKVANESKKYRYVGNGIAKKKTKSQLSEKHSKIDETDDLEATVIQENNRIVKTVYDVLKETDVKKEDKKNVEDNYKLNIKRDTLSRFKLEEYVKKIVLKNISEKETIVDLYCSIYPRQYAMRDNSFIREMKTVMETNRKTDFLDFKEMSFVSENAFGCDDYVEFSFDEIEFIDIRLFDGNFVVKFKCHNKGDVFGKNLLSEVYSESAEEKYKNKEKKDRFISTINLNDAIPKEEYNISDKIDLSKLAEVKLKND